MSVLHDLQNVTLEVDFAIEVGIVELLHGKLGSLIFSQVGQFEIDIMFDGLAGEGHLLIKTSTVFRGEPPVSNGQGDEEDNHEEPVECPSGFEG